VKCGIAHDYESDVLLADQNFSQEINNREKLIE
jgi:hypothetical protein